MTEPRHAWIDASAGVAGDMLLGALLDAGASLDRVRAAVDAVVPDTVTIGVDDVGRAGLRARHAVVRPVREDQPARTWSTIRALIEEAALPDRTRARALAVFGRLAAAEARVHGVPLDQVHFHEVGAWDSIADVVGVCAALEDLGVDSVSAGVVAVGSGRVRTAHGELSVPVPAVVELAYGWEIVAGGDGELATPTGMALVVALATSCEPVPQLIMERTGSGAGTRDTPGRANVTRVVVGRRPGAGTPDGLDPAVLLEANVDDLDPRLWPGVLDALLAGGASDAWLTPVLMKKGRPAHVLSVLAPPARADALRDAVFAHTTTFGLRERRVGRHVLARSWCDVVVRHGDHEAGVAVKLAHRAGTIVRATPEFAEVAAAAVLLGIAEQHALTLAAGAALTAGLEPGGTLPTAARASLERSS